MKKSEWNEGLNHIDIDLIEEYIEETDKSKKKSMKSFWISFGTAAACLVIMIASVLVMNLPKNNSNMNAEDDITNNNKDDTNTSIPSTSVMTAGNTITGKQEIVYGTVNNDSNSDADMLAPGFEIRTVIEAEVIEVLPDTYYYAASYSIPFHVAKLRVIASIRGDGLPKEIYLSYPYYDTTVFDGYERFVLSLDQVGVENYMMINDTQRRVDYFSNMFEVCTVRDLGYGSVIAFNDGKVDTSFWKKTTHYLSTQSSFLNSNDYPASRNSTISEVKSNIIRFANDDDYWRISERIYHYVTAEDIFTSQEAKEIRGYLTPDETNIFGYTLTMTEDRVIAEYTRVINGFQTDERIVINGYTGENGNVAQYGSKYTEEDLTQIPDIGNVLENMKLSEIKPPHITITEDVKFEYSIVTGVYRKAEDKIYGIIRIMWYYVYPDIHNAYLKDDCYYLYDTTGNGRVIERDELRELIGEDSFINRFSYGEGIAWD